jgi:hypothetical protein
LAGPLLKFALVATGIEGGISPSVDGVMGHPEVSGYFLPEHALSAHFGSLALVRVVEAHAVSSLPMGLISPDAIFLIRIASSASTHDQCASRLGTYGSEKFSTRQ